MKFTELYKEGTTFFYVKRDIEIHKMIGKLRPINQLFNFFYS
jgi:hypothetical protein